MVPSQLAREVAQSLKSLIRSEFPVASKFFYNGNENIISAFLNQEGSLIKGPWAQVLLPFPSDRNYSQNMTENKLVAPFHCLTRRDFGVNFPPYVHQIEVFRRLCGNDPRSTLVATGTGSGKTECFLLPIIDYCLNSDKKGIKAIIIYPMNALANDQAARLAKLIYKICEGKKKKVTAGIYVGDTSNESREMTENELIANHPTIRKNPPDILLTNYKMLDLLTFRPADQQIWDRSSPESLKFLVVDELHSFDGAQATDLACLIRRLRERTGRTGVDDLACVGASATIGGPDSVDQLCSFASQVFATEFGKDSVILEKRLAPSVFIEEQLEAVGDDSPIGSFPSDLQGIRGNSSEEFFIETLRAWFGGRYEPLIQSTDPERLNKIREQLARDLPRLEGFKRLLTDSKGKLFEIRELAKKWANGEFTESMNIEPGNVGQAEALIDSLLSLISQAKVGSRPFLQVRIQLWARSLSRMVSTVESHPHLVFSDDVDPDLLTLPLVVCRECGHAGWGTQEINSKTGSYSKISKNNQAYYRAWFSNSDSVRVLYPVEEKEFFEEHKREVFLLDRSTRELRSAINYEWESIAIDPSKDDPLLIPVWSPDLTVNTTKYEQIEEQGLFSAVANGSSKKVKRFENACPYCKRHGSLIIFGWSVSSLASSAVARVNASPYNQDPKILAFSDSVQDAAQTGGFLEARGYRSAVRQAMAIFLKSNGDSSVSNLITNLRIYWFEKCYEPYKNAFHQLLTEKFTDPEKLKKAEETLKKAAFISTFMPSDKQWWSSYERFVSTGQCGAFELVRNENQWKALFDLCWERLGWAVLEELGDLSQSGRSLLRCGVAGISYNKPALKTAAETFYKSLTQGDKALFQSADSRNRKVVEDKILRFLLAFMDQIRASGGFSAEVFEKAGMDQICEVYKSYLDTGNAFSAFNKTPFMPPRGPKLPPPHGVIFSSNSFDQYWPALTGKRNEGSWYNQRANRLLADIGEILGFKLSDDSYLRDFWVNMLSALRDARLIFLKSRTDGTQYVTIAPEKILVSNSLNMVRCSVCGKIHRVPSVNLTQWIGMRCLSNDCPGIFDIYDEEDEEDDFRFSGRLVRLNAREHTGLVSDKDRKEIETSFKSKGEPWGVNLITATPTLEMGVDIGALSTVLQCSMPPTKSSYVQRIGRAGRRDGNALAVSLVGANQHSLYFWTDPKEMLQGEVEVPGVFLGATAVLERQLFAYALSCWAREVGNEKMGKLREVLRELEEEKPTGFPANFLAWLKENQTYERIAATFIDLFDSSQASLNEEAKSRLKAFISPDSNAIEFLKKPSKEVDYSKTNLAERLYKVFGEVQVTRKNWEKKKEKLARDLKSLETGTTDESTVVLKLEYDQAIREMDALIKNELENKNLLLFLTDQGLLPNYAFPEAGIQVRSVVFHRNEIKEKGGVTLDVTEKSFTRTASAAMSELVPPNTFYAFSYRFGVDSLRVEGDSFETWRICRDCTHIEKNVAGKPVEDRCPNCGSPAWKDNGQLFQMIRMREVTVKALANRDRISENDESRRSVPSHKLLLIEPGSVYAQHKWAVRKDRLSVDIEYLSAVLIREINIGAKDDSVVLNKYIAGKEVSGSGFKICKECGKFYDPKRPRAHEITCSYFGLRDDELKRKEIPWISGLMIYREMTSEAVRIRIPVCDVVDKDGADVQTHSMIAAINLGLRKYFKGNVGHLRTELQLLPDGVGGYDRYIIIYDTVPGGTGYLKELGYKDPQTGVPEVLMKVFRLAWEGVDKCECSDDPEKDGCYKCVYQYSNASSRKLVSRRAAAEVLRKLVSLDERDVTPVDQSVVEDKTELRIKEQESALEDLFLKRLSKVPGFELKNFCTKHGNEEYLLQIKLSEQERKDWSELLGREMPEDWIWKVQTQPDMNQGGSHPSRPDFLISPYREADAKNFPYLVNCVFCDGWKFHRNIATDDVLKRQSLLNMNHRVWSLNWSSLQGAFPSPESMPVAPDPTFLEQNSRARREDIERAWKSGFGGDFSDGKNQVTSLFENGETSFTWLVQWLRNPLAFSKKASEFAKYRFVISLAAKESTFKASGFSVDVFTPNGVTVPKGADAKYFCCGRSVKKKDEDEGYYVEEKYFFAPKDNPKKLCSAIKLNDFSTHMTSERDKEPECAWKYFFDLADLLQFSSRLFIVTEESLHDEVYQTAIQPQINTLELQWREILQEIELDPEYYGEMGEIVRTLKDMQIVLPTESFVDGYDETALDKSTGLVWNKGKKKLIIFPSDDLGKVSSTLPEGTEIFTEKTENWQEKVKEFFASNEQ